MNSKNRQIILSIIVPIYNVEKYLKRCVDSLLNQDLSCKDYEIIMVNDGSTDSSYDIAKNIAQKQDNIVLLTQENKGLSGARNAGLKRAAGKYVLFVDSDDWIEADFLSKIIKIAEANMLDICFFRYLNEYDNNKRELVSFHPFKKGIVYSGEWLILHGLKVSSVWQNLYSLEFLKKTGIIFLEGLVHEDIDFNFRLYPLAQRVMFTDLLGYHYCLYGESITRTSNSAKIIKMIEGDFTCVYNITNYMKQHNYPVSILNRFIKYGNSILVSNMLRLINKKELTIIEKCKLLNKLKEYNLYPIRGRTLSWKTSFLMLIFNIEWLYKLLLRYNNDN